MPAKFEVYKDASGQFRFRLRAANNEIIAVSEAYTSKVGCIKGIESVKKYAPVAEIVDLSPVRERLEDYKKKVDHNKEEPVFQDFFTKNPSFLDPKVKETYPKYNLGGELFPDFLLILHDSTHLFVEIEKPGCKLFTKKGDPRAELTHGVQQMREYLKWAKSEIDFLRKRGCPKISIDNIRGLVIIGKESDLSRGDLERLENINAEVGGRFIIKTFDKVYEENKSILESIKKMAKK